MARRRDTEYGMFELDRSVVETRLSERREALGPRASLTWVLVLAIALGIAVRAAHVLPAGFPVNDGGLFYAMVEDLQAHDYQLPAFTSYNGAHIPYAYPPLAFYLAALTKDLTGWSLIDVFRLLPLLLSALTVVAFWAFARTLQLRPLTLIAAVTAFGLMPRAFIWLLMGGGLTRALGFLFAILSLHQSYRLYRDRALWRAWPAGVFAGLTALSHIQTASFVAFSTLVFLLLIGRHRGRHRVALLGTVLTGTVALAVCLPWAAVVIGRHGTGPFLSAIATGGSILTDPDARRALASTLLRLGVGSWAGASTAEPLFPLLGTLALLGALVSAVSRTWLFPVWWLTILILDTRAGLTYAAVPVAILAGVGVTEVILPAIRRVVGGGREWLRSARDVVGEPSSPYALTTRAGLVVLGFFVLYGTGGAMVKDAALPSDIRFLATLAPEEREAMRWVARNTPTEARVLVVPGSEWDGWFADKESEWFPVWAGRTSVGTVQGMEWLPDGAFKRMEKASRELKTCGHALASCLDDWVRLTGRSFTHVFVPQPSLPPSESYLRCCQLLLRSLREDARYREVYAGPGAVVFAKQ